MNLTKPVWVIISPQNQEEKNKQLYFAYNPYFNTITNICIVTYHVVYSKYNTKVKWVASKWKNTFSCEVFML